MLLLSTGRSNAGTGKDGQRQVARRIAARGLRAAAAGIIELVQSFRIQLLRFGCVAAVPGTEHGDEVEITVVLPIGNSIAAV